VARHFLGLYLLIVLTLAAVSWGGDKLLQLYAGPDPASDRAQTVALSALAARLDAAPASERKAVLADLAAKAGVEGELFARNEIAGDAILRRLDAGKIDYLQASAGRIWALKELADGSAVLAFKYDDPEAGGGGPRRRLEWAVTIGFYAAIALVIMLWIWPLRRDLRALDAAASRFGNKNWSFDARIKPGSQIHGLAETFRKMAARIEGLIASHKDMSNAVSHEIKTPLARIRFEIELAHQTHDVASLKTSLDNIKADVAEIDALVAATLSYAILERADVTLNLGTHDFAAIVPALAEQIAREARPELIVKADVSAGAGHVVCDLHLIESAIKNLLYNAVRHARCAVQIGFDVHEGQNRLLIDDDGPGIPEKDRERVFESFVQLDSRIGPRTGFGLGLAIVKRALEWHGGRVVALDSPLGGARFCATWPVLPPARAARAG
jgi:two-component system, OmpR family, sensor kinase